MILLAYAALVETQLPYQPLLVYFCFFAAPRARKGGASGDKCDETCNAAIGPHRLAGRFARANRERPRQGSRGAARRDDQRGLGHRRASGRGLRRRRTYGGAPL